MVEEWTCLTSSELSDLIEKDPLAVLLVGSTEQHGLHLPLGTDSIIGGSVFEKSLDYLPARTCLVKLPDLTIGVSPEHSGFPGTISYPSGLTVPMVVEIGKQIERSGMKRLLIINSHGGNSSALDLAGMNLRAEGDLLVAKVDYFRFSKPKEVVVPQKEWMYGFHGGAVETSMMMHLRPDLVKAEHFDDNNSKLEEMEKDLRMVGRDRAVTLYWMAHDLHKSGAVGNASISSEEMGKHLLDHYGRCLSEVILDMIEIDLDRIRK